MAFLTIIEALPHLANNEDEAVSKQLERAYRKRGIAFHTNTRFSRATQDENGVHVSTETGKTFDADILLVAVGRGPVTQGLGYEEAGIRMDRGFVLVDERLRTGVGSIRAVGDIVPGLQLAHRGFLQGIFVAEDIAEAIVWTLERPRHVNIDSMIVRPLAQATNTIVARTSPRA